MNHYALGVEVPPCSTGDLRRRATAIRKAIGVPSDKPFPIMHFVEYVLPEIYDDFIMEIVSPNILGDKHGETFPDKHIIRLREDVYIGACEGDGQHRFTVAHESSHLLQHEAVPRSMARRNAARLELFRNSEWQADTLAAELLMPAQIAKNLTPWEIEDLYKVSRSASIVRFDKLRKEKMQYGLVRI